MPKPAPAAPSNTATARRERRAPQSSMRPVRILQTSFHREWNGQVARIFLLSRELARRGHRAVIAAPAGSALARRAGAEGLALCTDVRFRKINRPLSFLRDVLVLGRLGRAVRVDILHT